MRATATPSIARRRGRRRVARSLLGAFVGAAVVALGAACAAVADDARLSAGRAVRPAPPMPLQFHLPSPDDAADVLLGLPPERRMDVLKHTNPGAPAVERAYRDHAAGDEAGWGRFIETVLRRDPRSLVHLMLIAVAPGVPPPPPEVERAWRDVVRRFGN